MPRLEELPPPEDGDGEGYYPDPLGGRYPRWWDGTRWTNQVGEEPTPPLAPGEHELVPRRPRDPSALVSAAFRLYRRYPLLFPALAAGVIIPYDLIVLVATGAGAYTQSGLSVVTQVVLGLVDWLLINTLVSALHVHAVADVRNGQDPRLGDVAARGLRVLPVVVAAQIMASLGIAAGLVALIVPGVILYFRWYVVAQHAAIEHRGWLPALRGSRELTAGNYAHIFVVGLFIVLIAGIPASILTAVLGDETTAVTFLAGLGAHLYLVSFTALTTALLYFDLVSRREASVEVVG
jgi:uncharacterized protein DUF2510